MSGGWQNATAATLVDVSAVLAQQYAPPPVTCHNTDIATAACSIQEPATFSLIQASGSASSSSMGFTLDSAAQAFARPFPRAGQANATATFTSMAVVTGFSGTGMLTIDVQWQTFEIAVPDAFLKIDGQTWFTPCCGFSVYTLPEQVTIPFTAGVPFAFSAQVISSAGADILDGDHSQSNVQFSGFSLTDANGNTVQGQLRFFDVPEPGSVALALVGLVLLTLQLKFRRRIHRLSREG